MVLLELAPHADAGLKARRYINLRKIQTPETWFGIGRETTPPRRRWRQVSFPNTGGWGVSARTVIPRIAGFACCRVGFLSGSDGRSEQGHSISGEAAGQTCWGILLARD